MTKPKGRKLNDRQSRFVTEYFKDWNGKQAAIRAGYAPGSAEVAASRLLTHAKVKAVVDEFQAKLRQKDQEKAESISDRIRRRLWEEADDFSEFASHSARIRAIELLGKIYGEFEIDNKQKSEPFADFLKSLPGNVLDVTMFVPDAEPESDE